MMFLWAHISGFGMGHCECGLPAIWSGTRSSNECLYHRNSEAGPGFASLLIAARPTLATFWSALLRARMVLLMAVTS